MRRRGPAGKESEQSPLRDRRDLAEARRIAERGEMGLRLCDCYLEWARLCLAQSDLNLAREHWTSAKAMVELMGYHRRDREVKEIALELGETNYSSFHMDE